jgi:hypothetical protein
MDPPGEIGRNGGEMEEAKINEKYPSGQEEK